MPAAKLGTIKKFLHLQELTGLAPVLIMTLGGGAVGGVQETIFKIPVNHILSFDCDLGGTEQSSSTIKLHDASFQLLDILMLNIYQLSQSNIPIGITFGYDDPSSVNQLERASGQVPRVNLDSARYLSPTWLMILMNYDYKITPSGVEIELSLIPPTMNTNYMSTIVYGTMLSLFASASAGQQTQQATNLWNDALKKAFEDNKKPSNSKGSSDTKVFSQDILKSIGKNLNPSIDSLRTRIKTHEDKLAKLKGNIEGGYTTEKEAKDEDKKIREDFFKSTNIKIPDTAPLRNFLVGTASDPGKVDSGAVITSEFDTLPIVNVTKIVDHALSQIESENEIYIPIYPRDTDFFYDYGEFKYHGRSVVEVMDDIAQRIQSIPLPETSVIFFDQSQKDGTKVKPGDRTVGCNMSMFTLNKEDAFSLLPNETGDTTKITKDQKAKLSALQEGGIVNFIFFQFKADAFPSTAPPGSPIAHITNYPITKSDPQYTFGNGIYNRLRNPDTFTESQVSNFASQSSNAKLANSNIGMYQLIEMSVDLGVGNSFGSAALAESAKMTDSARPPLEANSTIGEHRFGGVITNNQGTIVQIDGKFYRVEFVKNSTQTRKEGKPIIDGTIRIVGNPASANWSTLNVEIQKAILKEFELIKQEAGLTSTTLSEVPNPNQNPTEATKQKQEDLLKQLGSTEEVLKKQRDDILAEAKSFTSASNSDKYTNALASVAKIDAQLAAIKETKSNPNNVGDVLQVSQNLVKQFDANKIDKAKKRKLRSFTFGGINRVSDSGVSLEQEAKEYLDELRSNLQSVIPATIELTILGDPNWSFADLGKAITVNIQDATGEPTYLSGKYLVRGVKHSMGAGEFKTKINAVKDLLRSTSEPNTVSTAEIDPKKITTSKAANTETKAKSSGKTGTGAGSAKPKGATSTASAAPSLGLGFRDFFGYPGTSNS